MTRLGNSFAFASAVLAYIEVANAATTPPPTKNPTKAPTKNPTKRPTNPPTVYVGTGEWYADTANGNLCTKDCATSGSDPDCSGVNHNTATWLSDTYATAAQCCAQKFSYLDGDYCADRSSASPQGTNKYYADTSTNSCKIDDDPSLSKTFGAGTLFATAASCCSGALGWINSDYCTTRSEGGAGYHNKWYVDYQDMVCKKDCATASANPECEPVTDSSNSNTLFASAAACCSGKLGWIPSAMCESVSTSGSAAAATGTDKFYADYSNSPARCAKDCNTSDPQCGGINANSAGVQFFDTVAQCCTAKFNWMDSGLCASLTTGARTNKWYVDYQSNKCVQDCPVAANSPCGGTPPDMSMQLFNDAATCCSSKLGWVQKDTCKTVSEGGSAAASTGTLDYYADYSSGTCKKDCAASNTSPECGGVLSSTVGTQLFDTAAACCSAKFGWINKDLCVAMGTGGYTNKFYVDYASQSCKQDCAAAANTNCGGNPGDKSMQLFDTAAACCSSKLSYVSKASCESKSTTGTAAAAAATGSGKWYVDWSISKCAKDCSTSGDAECGGLAETWESAEYSSWQSCCSSRLSWMSKDSCHLG
jgi:hypothetical protein